MTILGKTKSNIYMSSRVEMNMNNYLNLNVENTE